MLGVAEVGPLTVNPKVPSPPTAVLLMVIVPRLVLVKVHVTVCPGATLKLPLQEALVWSHPAGRLVSVTV
jgi:hypothetical protein